MKYYVICQLFWELHGVINCNFIESFKLVMNSYVIFMYLEFHFLFFELHSLSLIASCIPLPAVNCLFT